MAEARSGQQAGAGARLLQDRIRCDGRAMDDLDDLVRPDPRLIETSREAGEHRFCRVSRCGGEDRKSVVWGKRVSVRVDVGGGSDIKKKNNRTAQQSNT